MKWSRLLFASIVCATLLCAGSTLIAGNISERLRHKAAQAQTRVKSLAAHGGDPSAILAIMQQVKPALAAGDPKQAEALLDRVLMMLDQAEKASNPAAISPLPIYTQPEEESDLYVNPQPVEIAGYDRSEMEPFISLDGRFLFFNNENSPGTNTDLYFAEHTGKLSFHFSGELPGVNSASLDAVPSIDYARHFYFTTLREYSRSFNSIYAGDFDGKTVGYVHAGAGDISPKTPTAVNMDASISPDGKTLYISRAAIYPGATAPTKSALMIARLKSGELALTLPEKKF